MNEALIPIPRIESRAPNGNTIEWEIPNKVEATLMLVDRIRYTIITKVKVDKKHWWNRSHKIYTFSSSDPAEALLEGLNFIETHGYFIDHKTIEIGEHIGEESIKQLEQAKDTDEFCKLTEAALHEIEDEIKRRSDLEDSFNKFLLDLDVSVPLETQFKKWAENNNGSFTDSELKDCAERAVKIYMNKKAT